MNFKYDKKDRRIFKFCSILLSALFLLSLVIYPLVDSLSANGWMIIVELLLMCLGIPALLSWIAFLDCRRYIKKVEESGVQVPEDKKKQPRPDQIPPYRTDTDCKESIILAVICFCLAGGILVYTLLFAFKWLPLIGDQCNFPLFFHLLLTVSWIIGGLVYYHQRLSDRYRSDHEFDFQRKERSNLPKGILTIVILLAFSFFALLMLHNMTDYLYRSRLEALYDNEWRSHIGESAIY